MVDDRCKSCESTPSCGRGCRWQPRYGAHKRGLNSKIHLAVDAHGMPVRVFITSGTVSDCTQAEKLNEGIDTEHLLADRGYDTDKLVEFAIDSGMNVVIPPKKNRIIQRAYDKEIYKLRHLVENAFLHLKRWRGICIRCAKKYCFIPCRCPN